MRRLVAGSVVVALCVAAVGCTVRSRRPDGPYRLAEEFADALSDESVACTREHTPETHGQIVVVAELTGADKPPVIHDAGSVPGSEAVLACVRERAVEKLRCPPTAPAAFVRIRVPVPLVTAEVKYAFVNELPSGSGQ